MKKIYLLFLASLLALPLTSCFGGGDNGGNGGGLHPHDHVAGEWYPGRNFLDREEFDINHHYKFCTICGELMETGEHHFEIVKYEDQAPCLYVRENYSGDGYSIELRASEKLCHECHDYHGDSWESMERGIDFGEEVTNHDAFISSCANQIADANHVKMYDTDFYKIDGVWFDSDGKRVSPTIYSSYDIICNPLFELRESRDYKIFKAPVYTYSDQTYMGKDFYVVIYDYATYDFTDSEAVWNYYNHGHYSIFDENYAPIKMALMDEMSGSHMTWEISFDHVDPSEMSEVQGKINGYLDYLNSSNYQTRTQQVLSSFNRVYLDDKNYEYSFALESFGTKLWRFTEEKDAYEYQYVFKDYDGWHYVDVEENVSSCEESKAFTLMPKFTENKAFLQQAMENANYLYAWPWYGNPDHYILFFDYAANNKTYSIEMDINLNYNTTSISIVDSRFDSLKTYQFALQINNRSEYDLKYADEIIEQYHVHAFSDEMAYDDEYHWYPALCGHDDICEKHPHEFTEWKTTREAKCNEYGLKERHCECGKKETQLIEMTEHDYGEWYEYSKATPKSKGIERRNCKVCNHYEERMKDYVFDADDWIFTASYVANPDALNSSTAAVYKDDPTINAQFLVKAVASTKDEYLADYNLGKDPKAFLKLSSVPTSSGMISTPSYYLKGTTSDDVYNTNLSKFVYNASRIAELEEHGYTITYHKYVLEDDEDFLVGYGLTLKDSSDNITWVTVDMVNAVGLVTVEVAYDQSYYLSLFYAFTDEEIAGFTKEYGEYIK